MSGRRALLPFLLLPFAACGGGSPSGPDAGPSTAGSQSVTVIVFYDENGNGALDASEGARVPEVEVTIGGRAGRSAVGTGRAVLDGVPAGSQAVSVSPTTLPPFYAPGRMPTIRVPVSGDVAVPLVLPIGANRPNTYMAFGDSITEGNNYPGDPSYRAPLEDKLRQYFGRATVINEGVGSTRSSQGAERIDGPLFADRPGYTLILYGTNDWNRSECKRASQVDTTCFTVSSLRDIVLSVKGSQSLPVLATIPPVNENFNVFAPPQRNDWIEAANVRIRELAREQGAALADVETAMLAVPDRGGLFVDHVHPSAAGEEIIASTFFNAIAHARSSSAAFTGEVIDLDAPPVASATRSARARVRRR